MILVQLQSNYDLVILLLYAKYTLTVQVLYQVNSKYTPTTLSVIL